MRQWRVPEIFLGALLAVSIFALGFSLSSPAPKQPASVERSEQAGQEDLSAFWHRTSDDPVALYTVLLTLFTAVLAVSTGFLWWETRRSVRLTRELHTAEQRPWLSLKLKSVTQVLKRDNYAEINYRPIVANVGHAPAFDVHAFHGLMRDFDASPKPNFDLFIQQSVKTYAEPSRERSGVVFPDREPDERSVQMVGEYRNTPQNMVGKYYLLFICIFYRAEPGGDVHHTASLYRLELVGGDFTSPDVVFSSSAEERPFESMGVNSAT